MKTTKIEVLCVVKNIFLLLLVSVAYGQDDMGPAFFDTPPSYYSERTTLRDCSKRFYSNINEADGYGGGYGGVRVYRGEFQHMVAIGWTRSNGVIDYFCGGSLISNQFVLTAAHCAMDSSNTPPDTVRIGDTDLGSPEDDEFAQQVGISRITTHPQYRGSRYYFDIAIVRLNRPANYSSAVCNACLWREEHVPRERMDAIGFGAIGFAEALSPTLQRVELDAIALSDCAKRITTARRQMPDGFRKDQFCAAGSDMDTCEGDSGGPIGVKRADVGGSLIPLVVGVVSFGTPCTVGSTGVYTKVSAFLDWIEQETNKSFDYIECARSSYCYGRLQSNIRVDFRYDYSKSRFGLLWDNADTSSLYECGATLIDDRFLITVATCVTSSKGRPKFVAYNKEERVAVTDVYVSPRYRAGSPENNLALIKVAKFVNVNMFRPACLWNRNIDGEWPSGARFRAFGPLRTNELKNETIFVGDWSPERCDRNTSDVICYTNSAKLIPGVCTMDYGGPVINGSIFKDPVYAYGLVSPLSKDCGENLYMIDVTPHIDWIESIIVHNRDKFLIFTD